MNPLVSNGGFSFWLYFVVLKLRIKDLKEIVFVVKLMRDRCSDSYRSSHVSSFTLHSYVSIFFKLFSFVSEEQVYKYCKIIFGNICYDKDDIIPVESKLLLCHLL